MAYRPPPRRGSLSYASASKARAEAQRRAQAEAARKKAAEEQRKREAEERAKEAARVEAEKRAKEEAERARLAKIEADAKAAKAAEEKRLAEEQAAKAEAKRVAQEQREAEAKRWELDDAEVRTRDSSKVLIANGLDNVVNNWRVFQEDYGWTVDAIAKDYGGFVEDVGTKLAFRHGQTLTNSNLNPVNSTLYSIITQGKSINDDPETLKGFKNAADTLIKYNRDGAHAQLESNLDLFRSYVEGDRALGLDTSFYESAIKIIDSMNTGYVVPTVDNSYLADIQSLLDRGFTEEADALSEKLITEGTSDKVGAYIDQEVKQKKDEEAATFLDTLKGNFNSTNYLLQSKASSALKEKVASGEITEEHITKFLVDNFDTSSVDSKYNKSYFTSNANEDHLKVKETVDKYQALKGLGMPGAEMILASLSSSQGGGYYANEEKSDFVKNIYENVGNAMFAKEAGIQYQYLDKEGLDKLYSETDFKKYKDEYTTGVDKLITDFEDNLYGAYKDAYASNTEKYGMFGFILDVKEKFEDVGDKLKQTNFGKGLTMAFEGAQDLASSEGYFGFWDNMNEGAFAKMTGGTVLSVTNSEQAAKNTMIASQVASSYAYGAIGTPENLAKTIATAGVAEYNNALQAAYDGINNATTAAETAKYAQMAKELESYSSIVNLAETGLDAVDTVDAINNISAKINSGVDPVTAAAGASLAIATGSEGTVQDLSSTSNVLSGAISAVGEDEGAGAMGLIGAMAIQGTDIKEDVVEAATAVSKASTIVNTLETATDTDTGDVGKAIAGAAGIISTIDETGNETIDTIVNNVSTGITKGAAVATVANAVSDVKNALDSEDPAEIAKVMSGDTGDVLVAAYDQLTKDEDKAETTVETRELNPQADALVELGILDETTVTSEVEEAEEESVASKTWDSFKGLFSGMNIDIDFDVDGFITSMSEGDEDTGDSSFSFDIDSFMKKYGDVDFDNVDIGTLNLGEFKMPTVSMPGAPDVPKLEMPEVPKVATEGVDWSSMSAPELEALDVDPRDWGWDFDGVEWSRDEEEDVVDTTPEQLEEEQVAEEGEEDAKEEKDKDIELDLSLNRKKKKASFTDEVDNPYQPYKGKYTQMFKKGTAQEQYSQLTSGYDVPTTQSIMQEGFKPKDPFKNTPTGFARRPDKVKANRGNRYA